MPLSQTQSKPEGEVLTNTNQINDIKTDDLGDKNIESIQRFEKLVADNYHDKDFNRKEVASEMALSERQLHRKLAGLVYTTSVTSYVSSVYNKPATC
jgi:DNA-directed RNA polymerase specialized sigma subunit